MTALTWFITGCSSGFGEILVRQLRAAGDNVIATGRNAETKLAHLKDTGAAILDLDVTAPAAEIQPKIGEAWEIYPGGIDVVVNNAGFIVSGAIEELTQEDMDSSFKVNFHGPLNITRAILPRFRAKNKGTLLYVGSQAAWHADPSAGSYCAAKFALSGAVECLAKELAIFSPGVKVLIVDPGYFRTKVFSNISHVEPHNPDYAQFNAGVRQFEASLVGKEPGDADKAVTRMIELVKGTGMAAGKQIPLRVPLGSDGWERVKTKCEETIKICEDWEEVAKSTDYTTVDAAVS
ncbi:short-chain oxidoreductase/hydroxylutyrate dehydrogenase [Trichoderma guizhouense]|uniref:Short-chain oxidoreductase/hydroxylutyrate dehydrogenase n=1 Tax=Trichoderma guizhouense TaxID=1491466 RepID=A0A1T3CW04_9HYPO|nr:short-chain oxidoreductase/hydroxylutyrate dehydrogenase [Trichoderma guizhouense]